MKKELNNEELNDVTGGCIRSNGDPLYYCNDCKKYFCATNPTQCPNCKSTNITKK